jgi:Outer membrane protein beta-barrel domain
MKFNSLVSAIAGVAILSTGAAAQVCQGDLSFRGSSKHVGAAFGMTDNATSFGAGLAVGHSKGWYGGGSLGMSSYDNIDGNSVAVGGGIGYAMPMAQKSKWQMCPNASLSLGFGPNFDVAGASTHLSTQTMALGVSLGTAAPLSKTISLLPFFSGSIAHTRLSAKVNGTTNSASDNYLLLGMGAGFQFSPSLVIRPTLSLAAGVDDDENIVDDTVFGLGVTWALRH